MWLHNAGILASAVSSGGSIYAQTVLDQNPVAYYRLEESSLTNGDTVFDETSNDLDGNVDFEDATKINGKIGQAIDYSANSSRVDVPSNTLFEPSNLTIEVWIKELANATEDFVGYTGYTSTGSWDDGYGLVRDSNGGLRFFVDQWDGTDKFVVDSNDSAFDGDWHLVHGVFDGSNIELFVDNSKVGSVSNSLSITYNSSVFRIAALGDATSDFPVDNAAIDEVALYDRALTSQERQAKLDAAS